MQNLKKSVMLAMISVFGVALAASQAHAQNGLAVDVPFDFVLGKSTLQSGQYRIARSGAAFVSFVDAKRNTKFAMLLPGGDVPNRNNQPYLVFTRYGQEAFLNKVVFSPGEVYELPLSGREKEMRAQLRSGDEVAVLIQPVR